MTKKVFRKFKIQHGTFFGSEEFSLKLEKWEEE